MSAGIETSAKRALPQPVTFADKWVSWLTRKRIAISLGTFSILIAYNLLYLKTIPFDPFAAFPVGGAIGTAVVAFGVFIRSWAAGTLHKSSEVTSVGPYSLTRNPLYVGSFLMMFGFCIVMKDWLAFAFVAGPMMYLYWIQVRAEERNLGRWFPGQWEDYCKNTGRLLPKRFPKNLLGGWSLNQWLDNNEYQAVLATLASLIALSLIYHAR